MMELAVGAAYTYLLYYPEHETMKNNVQYYRTLDNVQESYFKDLHAKKYQVSDYCMKNIFILKESCMLSRAFSPQNVPKMIIYYSWRKNPREMV